MLRLLRTFTTILWTLVLVDLFTSAVFCCADWLTKPWDDPKGDVLVVPSSSSRWRVSPGPGDWRRIAADCARDSRLPGCGRRSRGPRSPLKHNPTARGRMLLSQSPCYKVAVRCYSPAITTGIGLSDVSKGRYRCEWQCQMSANRHRLERPLTGISGLGSQNRLLLFARLDVKMPIPRYSS
jgi:hypothetical protein